MVPEAINLEPSHVIELPINKVSLPRTVHVDAFVEYAIVFTLPLPTAT